MLLSMLFLLTGNWLALLMWLLWNLSQTLAV